MPRRILSADKPEIAYTHGELALYDAYLPTTMKKIAERMNGAEPFAIDGYSSQPKGTMGRRLGFPV